MLLSLFYSRLLELSSFARKIILRLFCNMPLLPKPPTYLRTPPSSMTELNKYDSVKVTIVKCCNLMRGDDGGVPSSYVVARVVDGGDCEFLAWAGCFACCLSFFCFLRPFPSRLQASLRMNVRVFRSNFALLLLSFCLAWLFTPLLPPSLKYQQR